MGWIAAIKEEWAYFKAMSHWGYLLYLGMFVYAFFDSRVAALADALTEFLADKRVRAKGIKPSTFLFLRTSNYDEQLAIYKGKYSLYFDVLCAALFTLLVHSVWRWIAARFKDRAFFAAHFAPAAKGSQEANESERSLIAAMADSDDEPDSELVVRVDLNKSYIREPALHSAPPTPRYDNADGATRARASTPCAYSMRQIRPILNASNEETQ